MTALPERMTAAVYSAAGDASVIRLERRPIPVPSADEIVVKVFSTALNRADIAQREGRYPAPRGVPWDIPGLEFSGEVVQLGRSATRWRLGDRVFGLVPGGAHAEYVKTHQDTVSIVPVSVSWRDSGASPEMFTTAYDALVTQAQLQNNEIVLIHAATSGVGIAAAQIARLIGGRPYGTSRSPDKLARVHQHGFLELMVPDPDLPPTAFANWLGKLTGGHGADIVMDLIGGPYTTASVRALAPNGRLMLIGVLAGGVAEIDLQRVLARRIRIQGTVLRSRSLPERIDYTRRFSETVVPWLAEGRISPVIDSTFPLARLADAHRLLESNKTVGKIAITVHSG